MTDFLLQQARAEYGCCLDVSERVHRAYALRHDLIYVRKDGAILPQWSGHWDAIPLMLSLMTATETRLVFWLDADALIVGNEDIKTTLPQGVDLVMCRHPNPPHWNCGVLGLRNTARTRDWLVDVLDRAPGTAPHYQQAIMNELLDTPDYAGLCARLDDRWNSTVVLDGPKDCTIRAWHAYGNATLRAKAMNAEIARLSEQEVMHG